MHLDSIKKQVARVDDGIGIMASEDEYVKLLMSMTGIDVYAALLIRSETGDVSGFNNYKKLAWAGLPFTTSIRQYILHQQNNQARLKDAGMDNGRGIQGCC